ncbi:YciI family protein [Rathayibacter sp. YIM 133350]|uniref:YciI family protein n=1 Tax=Rathayibacter sp. YIM 133350 TaxID=3131992 RepID=UPI00307EC3EE
MQYALFLNYLEAQDADISEEAMREAMGAFDEYAAALGEAGAMVGVQILQPVAMSTTLTLRSGSLQVQDGPFIDTKERIGGVFVIDVPDLDAAIAWAERCPAAQWGSIEIRPTALTWSSERGWYQG